VDTQGLLLGVVVHGADVQDADGLWDLLKRLKPLYPWLRAVFADSIYNRLTALLACFLFGLTLIIVRRVEGSRGFAVQPRRWVVERSLGWLGRWRRLSKDYEELPEVSEPIRKGVESLESVVIPCAAPESGKGASCGSRTIERPRIGGACDMTAI
jgi:putative transposase